MCDEVTYEMRDGLTNSAIKMARAKFMNTILILESMAEIVVPRNDEEQNENLGPTRSFIQEFLQNIEECEKSKQTLRLWKAQVFDTLNQDTKVS